jgi:hypothetical protein
MAILARLFFVIHWGNKISLPLDAKTPVSGSKIDVLVRAIDHQQIGSEGSGLSLHVGLGSVHFVLGITGIRKDIGNEDGSCRNGQGQLNVFGGNGRMRPGPIDGDGPDAGATARNQDEQWKKDSLHS